MFDAAGFLRDHFTDPNVLCEILARYDVEAPKNDTVRKWFSRGSVPGDWLAVLVAIAQHISGGTPPVHTFYVTGGPEWFHSKMNASRTGPSFSVFD